MIGEQPTRVNAKPLSNRIVAISVSESPDLGVLGFLDGEDKAFLGAVLTPLVYGDARVAFGGRIEHPGSINFTLEISGQLAETYRRSDTGIGMRPMIQYLRAADAQHVGAEKLFDHALRLGAHSEIRLLWGEDVVATLLPCGRIVDVHIAAQAPMPAASAAELQSMPALRTFFTAPIDDGLAAMRRALTRDLQARILMGGAIARTAQGTSGLVAEALAAIDAGKPLLVIGGVGGASRDVAARLGLIEESQLVVRAPTAYVDLDGKPSRERYEAQLQEVAARRAAFERTVAAIGMGEELKRLAISESQQEISALIITLLTQWTGDSHG